jgi:hypothetical protein
MRAPAFADRLSRARWLALLVVVVAAGAAMFGSVGVLRSLGLTTTGAIVAVLGFEWLCGVGICAIVFGARPDGGFDDRSRRWTVEADVLSDDEFETFAGSGRAERSDD